MSSLQRLLTKMHLCKDGTTKVFRLSIAQVENNFDTEQQ